MAPRQPYAGQRPFLVSVLELGMMAVLAVPSSYLVISGFQGFAALVGGLEAPAAAATVPSVSMATATVSERWRLLDTE